LLHGSFFPTAQQFIVPSDENFGISGVFYAVIPSTYMICDRSRNFRKNTIVRATVANDVYTDGLCVELSAGQSVDVSAVRRRVRRRVRQIVRRTVSRTEQRTVRRRTVLRMLQACS
jgi:hypothetical protein